MNANALSPAAAMRSVRWACVLLCVASISARGAAPRYHLTDLGIDGEAYDVNGRGQVVGNYTVNEQSYAFVYSGGTLTNLGTLPGGDRSQAFSINDNGQIAGESVTSSGGDVGFTHAFLYQADSMTDLGTLVPGTQGSVSPYFSFAYGINSRGQVVGLSETERRYEEHAFVYSEGQMMDLGTLPGGTRSIALGINDSGLVVGGSLVSGGAGHAFLYAHGTMTDLGTLPGGTLSGAYAINGSGQIVGSSTVDAAGTSHAFLYSDGTMRDLGTLPGMPMSSAYDINAMGQIIGSSYWNATARSFLYCDGTMYDLASLVDSSGAGWRLDRVYAINDSGWIVGTDYGMGSIHGFLLTPIPEPSTFVLGTLGLLILAVARQSATRRARRLGASTARPPCGR